MAITVDVIINSTIDTVWKTWVSPDDIKIWNAASDDWHTTIADVNLTVGGEFLSRMEAKDGSAGFDLTGVYTNIIDKQLIEFSLEDGRNVSVVFEAIPTGVKITETFDAEQENTIQAQKQGWQSILNNFAKYVEALN